jgi:hypothetical protein
MSTDGTNMTINPNLVQESLPATSVPYGVTKSSVQPSVVFGGATPRPLDGVGADDGTNRIDVTVSGPVIYGMGLSGRYNNRTQIQAAAGVTVQVSMSSREVVAADKVAVALGGGVGNAMWTTVTLTNGFATIEGSVTGVYFTGTGRAVITKQ